MDQREEHESIEQKNFELSGSKEDALQNEITEEKVLKDLEDIDDVSLDYDSAPNILVSQNRDFYIVGIGGSAGSFEAIELFLSKIPADSGAAYVIVQHLDPDHISILSDLLKRSTAMEVIKVEDGIKVQPNKVYVIPEGKEMAILQGTLLLFQTTKVRGKQMYIDSFLESLAHDWGDKAVGIIFSGMGSDGESGARFIKEAVGMVMVQDPETAKYPSMPDSCIKTALVDYVASPENLAAQLLKYLKYPVSNLRKKGALSEKKITNAMNKIFHLLRSKTGNDFSAYKPTALLRRFDRKMQMYQIDDLEDLVTFLQENPKEVELLFKELLIGVTKFFRDFEAFKVLEEKILPQILKKKNSNDSVRVWVAGCSTGEEAYSVAILLKEALDNFDMYQIGKVQIYATDLDAAAITKARNAVYLNNIAGDISESRLHKYFDKIGEKHYQVKKEIRELVVFAEHNIISDPSFINLDLLTCRNLLIYFIQDLQKKLLPVFHYSLKPGGYLFLGSSESVGGFEDLFSSVNSKWKIYQRKENASSLPRIILFPSNPTALKKREIAVSAPEPGGESFKLPELIKKIIIEKHTPPTIVINYNGDMLYIIGRTGRYLEPAPGKSRMNIFEMAREGLGVELRSGLIRSSATKEKVILESLKVKTNGDYSNVKVTIDPVSEPEEFKGLFLVLFEELPEKTEITSTIINGELSNKDHIIHDLEKELKQTKEHLQHTIEEMETSLEELKSTNEELQSTNEELQSTNEESTTAKEEMLALNEELLTVNVEIRAKTEQLSRLNNDMVNFLNGSEIATIFLDNSLRITRFTSSVNKIINLEPTDIGRPISMFKTNLKFDGMVEDIKEVIEVLVSKKVKVETDEGNWFLMRILPYRTVDNFINGAVITFNEINELVKLEKELKESLSFTENIINSLRDPLVVLDNNLKVVSFNDRFASEFNANLESSQGILFYDLGNGEWNIHSLKQLLEDTLKKDKEFNGFEVEQNFSKVGKKKVTLNGRRINNSDKNNGYILLVIEKQK